MAPIAKPPEWFTDQMGPVLPKAEVRQRWEDYLNSLRTIQYHGVRTGSGPCEVSVFIEYPDSRYTTMSPDDWYCEAEAIGALTGTCSPENRVHDAPCGYRPTPPHFDELADPFGNAFDWGVDTAHSLWLARDLLDHALPGGASRVHREGPMDRAFKDKIIARLPRHEWTLDRAFIREWVDLHNTTGGTP